MDDTIGLLLTLVRMGLAGTDTADGIRLPDRLTPAVWAEAYRQATGQGVLALAWDGVQRSGPDHAALPRRLRLQWALNTERIECRYRRQRAVAAELAERFRAGGLRTVVLKGLAVSAWYPRPDHRPAGDLDCYLMGRSDEGDRIAREAGAEVRCDFYKHSHIVYKGLTVENHRYCTAIRGSRRAKEFERELQRVLAEGGTTRIDDTPLEAPSELFQALFLTHHALGHFLSEGIALRHLCDWTVLLRKGGDRIEWSRFAELASRYGQLPFADAMTRLAVRLFGASLPAYDVASRPEAEERLLRDVFDASHRVHSTGAAAWRLRLLLLGNALRSGWKYRIFTDTSAAAAMLRAAVGFCTERNPRL